MQATQDCRKMQRFVGKILDFQVAALVAAQ
jgi:hypothetical protein